MYVCKYYVCMYVCMYVEVAQIVKQMYPCIRQRTLFFVTLRREKPCPMGPSLCTATPSPQKRIISLSPIFFRGGGDCTQASRCEEGGGWLHQVTFISLRTAIISRNQQ